MDRGKESLAYGRGEAMHDTAPVFDRVPLLPAVVLVSGCSGPTDMMYCGPRCIGKPAIASGVPRKTRPEGNRR
uniref:Uncharacterized protein n=1 Tax=mine drainage metagenome TaxID=410659 RepID=E6PQL0_9ZZZZ